MKKVTVLTLSSLLMTNAFHAAADQVTIDTIEAAAHELDINTLKKQQQASIGYDQALASYYLAVSFNIRNQTELSQTNLDSAINTLDASLKQSPSQIEVHILLAQCYGFKAKLKPLEAAELSSSAKMHLSQAQSINSDNPRLHLIKGIASYNTPAIYGGSKQAAFKSFNLALKQYADDKGSGYYWGEAEAYVWRGLSQLELNNLGAAMNDWGSALRLSPRYGWPRFLIQNNQ